MYNNQTKYTLSHCLDISLTKSKMKKTGPKDFFLTVYPQGQNKIHIVRKNLHKAVAFHHLHCYSVIELACTFFDGV
jgi:hypothetical protein